MTNLLFTVALLTNTITALHPSGLAGYRTNIIYRLVPIATNVEVIVWQPLVATNTVHMTNEMRPPRRPLTERDTPPMPAILPPKLKP